MVKALFLIDMSRKTFEIFCNIADFVVYFIYIAMCFLFINDPGKNVHTSLLLMTLITLGLFTYLIIIITLLSKNSQTHYLARYWYYVSKMTYCAIILATTIYWTMEEYIDANLTLKKTINFLILGPLLIIVLLINGLTQLLNPDLNSFGGLASESSDCAKSESDDMKNHKVPLPTVEDIDKNPNLDVEKVYNTTKDESAAKENNNKQNEDHV